MYCIDSACDHACDPRIQEVQSGRLLFQAQGDRACEWLYTEFRTTKDTLSQKTNTIFVY